jgi:isopentenyl diphosphate isomerase/L-lactate dehydrogenase-like FMN-dependent dehydrogenase
VLKALALVPRRRWIVGRPVVYGSPWRRGGVRAVLEMLWREIDLAWRSAACATVATRRPDLVLRR